MKVAIIFFALGIGQGFILTDWVRSKQELHIAINRKSRK